MQDSSQTDQTSSADRIANLSQAQINEKEMETPREMQKRCFREGVRACSPSLIGITAWGLVTGIAMIKSGFTLVQALGMTFFVFAGSAQLAALPLIVLSAPVWVIFLTGLMINLRFVIFSVIIAPHFTYLKFWQKAFWGYMTGDVSMVYFMSRFPTEQAEPGKFEYMKGLFAANWVAWQLGSVAGIFLGNLIPQSWGVGFAGTLAILCVLLPMILKRATLAGVIAASAIALATYHWPYKLGMLAAVIVGMLCSMAWEEWQERHSGTSGEQS